MHIKGGSEKASIPRCQWCPCPLAWRMADSRRMYTREVYSCLLPHFWNASRIRQSRATWPLTFLVPRTWSRYPVSIFSVAPPCVDWLLLPSLVCEMDHRTCRIVNYLSRTRSDQHSRLTILEGPCKSSGFVQATAKGAIHPSQAQAQKDMFNLLIPRNLERMATESGKEQKVAHHKRRVTPSSPRPPDDLVSKIVKQ